MKKYGWLIAIVGVFALGAILIFGAALGAGITYFFLQAHPVQAAFAAPQTVDNTAGVLISAVEPGSPAAEAGLVRGDIILNVNSVAVNNLFDLQNALSEVEPGETVELTVVHGDETRTLTAELGDRSGLAYLGVSTCGGPSSGGLMFNGPMGDIQLEVVTPGVEVTEVVAGSPAEEAGLQVGDVILSVDGEEIGQKTGFAEMIQAHEPGDKVTLEVQSAEADESRQVTVTLGENPDIAGQAYLGVGYRMAGPSRGAMPHFFFQNGEEFKDQLPEDLEEGEGFFFHGMPFSGRDIPNLDQIPELPEGVEGAVVISKVIEDTPAAQADLQPGDLILAVDGEPVTKIEAFTEVLQSHKPGDEVTLTVYRANEELKVAVTLTEHPDDPEKGFLGVLAGTYVKIEDLQLPEGFDQDFELELPGVPGGDA